MAIDYSHLAQPKGVSRKTLKGRKDRVEAKVTKAVRAACVYRDGYCRVSAQPRGFGRALDVWGLSEDCSGPAEWAHMHERRRSKTRHMAAEIRHDARYSLLLCRFHHREYDAHRLIITALTRKGADGPLRFRRAK